MKLRNLAVLASVTIAAPAIAFADTSVDANGDGVLTIEEVQAVIPELDADGFSVLDVNGDGALDEAEIAAAQEAGVLPPSNG